MKQDDLHPDIFNAHLFIDALVKNNEHFIFAKGRLLVTENTYNG